MAKTKKVILFIAEGPTDEAALSPILKKIFQSSVVHFHVVHGDITTEFESESTNAVKTVNEHIKSEMDKYAYKRSDLIRIIHLVDTDGAFIPNENIVFAEVEKLHYGENEIMSKNVQGTLYRNEKKQRVLGKLSATPMIAGTPYSVYYFSRNLEHVLHNNSGSLNDDEKIGCADDFVDTYIDDTDGFVAFLSDSDFTVQGTYGETWHFIRQGTNSLHRHCNLHLLFESIDEPVES